MFPFHCLFNWFLRGSRTNMFLLTNKQAVLGPARFSTVCSLRGSSFRWLQCVVKEPSFALVISNCRVEVIKVCRLLSPVHNCFYNMSTVRKWTLKMQHLQANETELDSEMLTNKRRSESQLLRLFVLSWKLHWLLMDFLSFTLLSKQTRLVISCYAWHTTSASLQLFHGKWAYFGDEHEFLLWLFLISVRKLPELASESADFLSRFFVFRKNPDWAVYYWPFDSLWTRPHRVP